MDADSQVDDFCSVTGATRDRALFFLQAAKGNLQVALDAFYNEESVEDQAEATPPSAASTSRPPPEKSKVASLSDYRSSEGPKDDEDEGQSFFAGGSEHSGQMISGPPRKKKDIAKEVFDAAKQQGAVPLEEVERQKASQKNTKFQGTGFRLGDTEGPSEYVPGIRVSVAKDKVTKKLSFWRNGFSVDDGPLRDGQSPEDREFLHSISKGEIPHELRREARGGEVDINIEDRRNEDFVQKKPKLVPFSGAGQKLGNITPEVVQSTASASQATPTGSTPTPSVSIDTSQPVTSVQIRLADGTRLVGKFNHSHTVADIKQFIIESHPEMAHKDFSLLTTFPNKLLTDLSQSLADAKLLNAVVVQRFC